MIAQAVNLKNKKTTMTPKQWIEKIEINKIKYPSEVVKGDARKYSEY